MKTYGPLNPEAYEAFLAWLSPDGDEAARKFEQLRKTLIRFFERGGCHVPDELFDESVNRSGGRLMAGAVDRSVDPIRYCHGVAKNVLREYWRFWRDIKLEPLPPALPSPRAEPGNERELACLDECLEKLEPHKRNLALRFYRHEGRERIEEHKKMAAEEGGANSLRIKVFRIRNTLRDCVAKCLQQDDRAPLQ